MGCTQSRTPQQAQPQQKQSIFPFDSSFDSALNSAFTVMNIDNPGKVSMPNSLGFKPAGSSNIAIKTQAPNTSTIQPQVHW